MSLTISALISSFRTDQNSRYWRLNYKVKVDRDRYLTRIDRDYGHCLLESIDSRTLTTWYKQWTEGGKLAVGKAFVGQLRALFSHGGFFLEDSESQRLYDVLDRKRFKPIQPRNVRMTSEQARAIRAKARECSWYSVALAQAFQYELLMRQKDVIGDWLPKAEAKQEVYLEHGGQVWTDGLRWEEIDDQFILRHPNHRARTEHSGRPQTLPNGLDGTVAPCGISYREVRAHV